jgi:hypothetical protein
MLTRRLAPQPFEHREPVLIAGNRLAIDQAGTHLEPVNGLTRHALAAAKDRGVNQQREAW